MKIHKTTSATVIEALKLILEGGQYADKVVETTLKSNAKFGSRDRRFIAQSIYDCVRWWRLLYTQANVTLPMSDADYWTVFGVYLKKQNILLPDWEEFSAVPEELKPDADYDRKTRASIPDWLDEIGEKELGANWEKEITALNDPATIVLRVNTIKTTKANLIKLLANQNITVQPVENYEDVLVLNERQNLKEMDLYKNGFFEIQDASSQLIADFLDLKNGLTIIDACAGAGGKSLHIAAKMKNTGKIIALDLEGRKLEELRKRAIRGGVTTIATKTIDGTKTIESLKNQADRLLLDVPCTGLGVLKRNPDAKWKITPAFLGELLKTQQHILTTYSEMLKSNGIMVYATCSVLPSENEKQVALFLKNNSSFSLLKQRSVMPSEGFDGFFMAALKKE